MEESNSMPGPMSADKAIDYLHYLKSSKGSATTLVPTTIPLTMLVTSLPIVYQQRS
jgi:hypothetical protein